MIQLIINENLQKQPDTDGIPISYSFQTGHLAFIVRGILQHKIIITLL